MSLDDNVTVDSVVCLDRIQRRLSELWEIGRVSGGGVTRMAYSPEETEAHEYLCAELPDAYSVSVDPVGNLFATRAPDAERFVATGSHLDSVYNAGKLDGTLGVVCSLEAVEAFHAVADTSSVAPLLIVFRAEESARFGHHTIGSRAALGDIDSEVLAATDDDDTPVWQAMEKEGFSPEALQNPTVPVDRLAAFLEIHIEQGRVLDEAPADTGVVTSIRAPARHTITVRGEYDHSGATPMALRQDALSGAAEMVQNIETTATEATREGDIVATVGDITAVDGAINKVCGEVSFSLDIRSTDADYRQTTERRLLEACQRAADRRDLEVEITTLERSEPVALDEHLQQRLQRGADVAGCDPLSLPSGGGHDAMNFQLAGVPAGLLFVPSIDGVSHSPDEQTPEQSITAATRTLAHTLLSYADDRDTSTP